MSNVKQQCANINPDWREENMNKIIKGSQKWTKIVPDEYAIKCMEQYVSIKDDRDRILKFQFVIPAGIIPGSGFIQGAGITTIPMNTEGVVICLKEFSFMPNIYFRNNGYLSYEGNLTKCEIEWATDNPPKFYKTYYYSERNMERQKSDADAPEWLKKFARENNANVAYFEF